MILTPNASLMTRIARPQKSLLSSFVRLWAGQGFYTGTTAPALAPLFKGCRLVSIAFPLALVWCFVVIFNVHTTTVAGIVINLIRQEVTLAPLNCTLFR